MSNRIFAVLSLVAAFASAAVAPGCSSEDPPVEGVATPEDAIVEEHEGGSAAWSVAPDGKVQVRVAGPEGKAIREKISGTLAWKGDAKAEAKTIPLDLDAKAGLLIAAGPKLEADLTEVGYTLTVTGQAWSGTLHLPKGGTAALVAAAKASAEASASIEGKVGPHGGVIQIVGGNRYEIVADEVTGEVRVYLLDADLKLQAIGKRKVTVAVVADVSEIVVLVPHASGLYVEGKWNIKSDPVRVTLAVEIDGKVEAAIVGHVPGGKFALHAKGPRLKVRVKAPFDGDVDAKFHADAKANAKVKVDAPDVDVKVKVKAPDVKVKVKAPDVDVNKKASASAKAGGGKAKAKASAGASIKF